MSKRVILASASSIRNTLLLQAGVQVQAQPARVDEEAIKSSLLAEGAGPRDVADALAEFKARRVSEKHPDALVIGCDQVLDFRGKLVSKADNPKEARAQLAELRGNRHKLLSAVVVYQAGRPEWRHVGEVRLTMRDFSDTYLDDYLHRNWESVRTAVGCYKLEEEGVRLFDRIEGDYFTVLGLPLLELLRFLSGRGVIAA